MWTTGLGKERLSRGRLLRACLLLTALCVCLHVCLEKARRGVLPAAPPPPASGRPTHAPPGPDRSWGGGPLTRARGGGVPAAAEPPRAPPPERDRTVRRRVSYVRTPRKDQRTGDGEDVSSPPTTCCPPLHLNARRSPRWHIDLEPWASDSRSLEDEARRFLNYITTPQVPCLSLTGGEKAEGPWAACLDPKYSLTHRIQSRHCRIYSLGLGEGDRALELSLSRAGCEVHCFDPSLKQPHLQQADMWLHRLSVDWRDPNPAIPAQYQHANTKKLATILNDFGHRQVDVLKADMESAEWKILENLLLEGVLDSVGQLLLELHLHWAGFEVGGDDPTVVRYWFSLLKELERANFRLFRSHSDPAKPRLFLHKNVLDASSVYTLGWVNTQWKP